MKTRLIFAVLIFSASFTFSQNSDLKQTFINDISKYLTDFNDENWQDVVDQIYPKLFEFMSKDQMISTFEQMESMGMELKNDFIEVDNLSAIYRADSNEYCRVYYHATVFMKIIYLFLMKIV